MLKLDRVGVLTLFIVFSLVEILGIAIAGFQEGGFSNSWICCVFFFSLRQNLLLQGNSYQNLTLRLLLRPHCSTIARTPFLEHPQFAFPEDLSGGRFPCESPLGLWSGCAPNCTETQEELTKKWLQTPFSSHLASLWGGTPGVTFESLFGFLFFNSVFPRFCVVRSTPTSQPLVQWTGRPGLATLAQNFSVQFTRPRHSTEIHGN